jgi:hypothetical protein
MKTLNFIHAMISHHLKNPHSKALEPDCLSPWLAIVTQSPVREGPVPLPDLTIFDITLKKFSSYPD